MPETLEEAHERRNGTREDGKKRRRERVDLIKDLMAQEYCTVSRKEQTPEDHRNLMQRIAMMEKKESAIVARMAWQEFHDEESMETKRERGLRIVLQHNIKRKMTENKLWEDEDDKKEVLYDAKMKEMWEDHEAKMIELQEEAKFARPKIAKLNLIPQSYTSPTRSSSVHRPVHNELDDVEQTQGDIEGGATPYSAVINAASWNFWEEMEPVGGPGSGYTKWKRTRVTGSNDEKLSTS
jgi:hypothetical protein